MVRHATIADIPELVRMGAAFSDVARLPFSSSDFSDFCRSALSLPTYCFLISGKQDGMLCAAASPWLADRSTIIAQELFWWVDPTSRGAKHGVLLLNEFEKWASSIGARYTSVCNIEHLKGDAVGKLFERNGYSKRESSFVKEL